MVELYATKAQPLISSVIPDIKPSYSETKYKTALATSFGEPACFNGIVSIVLSADSFVVCVLWKEVPRINPGATQFNRIL